MAAMRTKAPATLLAPEKNQAFCPGCGHGIVVRLIHEVMEEMGLADKNVMILGVGCSCNINSLAVSDVFQCAHGRASAVATGVKRQKPELLTVAYQGDGDAAVIGLSETMNAAYRNENITLIMINNTNFGMTGGQMSWTTLPGEKTETSKKGRNCDITGLPMHVPEMMAASFPKAAYIARGSTHDIANINKTKQYIRNAFEAQMNKEGYSMVEILCACPTNWHLSPLKCQARIASDVIKEYPVGEFKTRRNDK